MCDMDKKPNAKALLPIVVFLVLYLGCGIYFEYIAPAEGQMGFYVVSVVVAFVIALVVAFLQNRSLSFDEKIHVCARGIGDDNIVIMLFIFLMAGAFSGIASAAGGAESTANLLLDILPAQAAIPGLFVIACIISLAMGTSVGTITVLTPIAVTVAASAGFNLPLCVGTVVGGAMFGDNLSFISDTTIAATRTQGVNMKDKFLNNFRIALPAALITLGILIAMAIMAGTPALDDFEYNIWQAIPYFVVLIAALCGINVFLVLGGGIVLFAIVGGATGSLDFASAFSAMGTGTAGMRARLWPAHAAARRSLREQHGSHRGFRSHRQAHRRGVRYRARARREPHRHLQLHRAGHHPLRRAASRRSESRRHREHRDHAVLVLPVPVACLRAHQHRPQPQMRQKSPEQFCLIMRWRLHCALFR